MDGAAVNPAKKRLLDNGDHVKSKKYQYSHQYLNGHHDKYH